MLQHLSKFKVVQVWGVIGLGSMVYVVYAAFTYSPWAAQVFGVIGSGASVLGIGFTLYQVWETKRLARDAKRASDAAREATDKAIEQLTSSNYRYSLLSAKTLLREASAFVMAKRWPMASLRVMDVASKASELAYARPLKDEVWVAATVRLREWARLFGEIQTNRPFDGALNDWDDLCNVLHDKIDKECGPFGLGEEA